MPPAPVLHMLVSAFRLDDSASALYLCLAWCAGLLCHQLRHCKIRCARLERLTRLPGTLMVPACWCILVHCVLEEWLPHDRVLGLLRQARVCLFAWTGNPGCLFRPVCAGLSSVACWLCQVHLRHMFLWLAGCARHCAR